MDKAGVFPPGKTPGIRGYGGIGRRARLRIWWVTVQVRDLLSAPDILPVKAVPRPLLWTRDFHIVLFVIFESFRDLFDALLHEILTPGVEGREALCG